MNIEGFRNYCLAKRGVTEEFPFDANTLVFKVMGKMFALTDLEAFESINLKADPEQVVALQEQFSAVLPGYHMNKKHWISVMMDGTIKDSLICQWIDDSYNLVSASLPKKDKEMLKQL
ncbi:MAG: MmcQ/YjbR family DNA-binding protein [Cyclobacteriaceae bacterium]|nr:MmcQ/YjbR family DNA-binding protein [Cyclobacteriaceae bacterium]NBP68641.1 MmcQ/YjbR family DNA-binding protein [Cytophagia bacterium]NBW36901.1 MmcQ/YjbR family DNA-binding protein [Cytophagia bacterium]